KTQKLQIQSRPQINLQAHVNNVQASKPDPPGQSPRTRSGSSTTRARAKSRRRCYAEWSAPQQGSRAAQHQLRHHQSGPDGGGSEPASQIRQASRQGPVQVLLLQGRERRVEGDATPNGRASARVSRAVPSISCVITNPDADGAVLIDPPGQSPRTRSGSSTTGRERRVEGDATPNGRRLSQGSRAAQHQLRHHQSGPDGAGQRVQSERQRQVERLSDWSVRTARDLMTSCLFI
uniref:Uncharacterized protein n=1 Tax=Macrostomum lignano TaxID=282301 RepID=A0A1I8F8E1_9PLAT